MILSNGTDHELLWQEFEKAMQRCNNEIDVVYADYANALVEIESMEDIEKGQELYPIVADMLDIVGRMIIQGFMDARGWECDIIGNWRRIQDN